jgi:hypothetical protein
MNQNNSKNLIKKNNFQGLFIDYMAIDKSFEKDNIKYHKEFLTKENINEIIGKYYEGEIDFLSIDVDGIDLYLLDELNVVNPRVLCIEYCSSIGKKLSVTVQYKKDFDRDLNGARCILLKSMQ